MDILTKQWYNTLVSELGLNPKNFQLYQGSTPLGQDSPWLWNILDSIPPESIDQFYDPVQRNNFSQNYQSVISQLYPMPISGNQVDIEDVLTQANIMLARVEKTKIGYAYSLTINKILDALESASCKSFQFDSETASSDINKTWAKKTQGNTPGFFNKSKQKNSKLSKFESGIINSRIRIKCCFDKVVCLEGHPLQKPSDQADLENYLPWYHKEALTRAYRDKTNSVWKPGMPSWESTFGEHGNMQRDTYGVVIVDGIKLKMSSDVVLDRTSKKGFSSLDLNNVPIWPFYLNVNNKSIQNKTKSKSGRSIHIEVLSPPKKPQLIGVLVSKIANEFNQKIN